MEHQYVNEKTSGKEYRSEQSGSQGRWTAEAGCKGEHYQGCCKERGEHDSDVIAQSTENEKFSNNLYSAAALRALLLTEKETESGDSLSQGQESEFSES